MVVGIAGFPPVSIAATIVVPLFFASSAVMGYIGHQRKYKKRIEKINKKLNENLLTQPETRKLYESLQKMCEFKMKQRSMMKALKDSVMGVKSLTDRQLLDHQIIRLLDQALEQGHLTQPTNEIHTLGPQLKQAETIINNMKKSSTEVDHNTVVKVACHTMGYHAKPSLGNNIDAISSMIEKYCQGEINPNELAETIYLDNNPTFDAFRKKIAEHAKLKPDQESVKLKDQFKSFVKKPSLNKASSLVNSTVETAQELAHTAAPTYAKTDSNTSMLVSATGSTIKHASHDDNNKENRNNENTQNKTLDQGHTNFAKTRSSALNFIAKNPINNQDSTPEKQGGLTR